MHQQAHGRRDGYLIARSGQFSTVCIALKDRAHVGLLMANQHMLTKLIDQEISGLIPASVLQTTMRWGTVGSY